MAHGAWRVSGAALATHVSLDLRDGVGELVEGRVAVSSISMSRGCVRGCVRECFANPTVMSTINTSVDHRFDQRSDASCCIMQRGDGMAAVELTYIFSFTTRY